MNPSILGVAFTLLGALVCARMGRARPANDAVLQPVVVSGEDVAK